ncbi:MAG: NAD(P)H-binding protein [Bacteroidales bacterium]
MNRSAAIFGSTGLVGKHLLKVLAESKNYGKVYAYSRKPLTNLADKFSWVEITDDFTVPAGADDVFVCLGTTMKKAGSKKAFWKVDYELVVTIAQRAKMAGGSRLIVISSIGANPKSLSFYQRTKGEMEEMVKSMGFELCAIVRPSLLLGKRDEFRFVERLGILFYKAFGFILTGPFRKYRGIDAIDVAKSMASLASSSSGVIVVESNILKQIADVYQP